MHTYDTYGPGHALSQLVPAGTGSVCVGMDARPSPTDLRSDGLCLSDWACLKGHVWLCRYLQQHVGVMVDLFIYSSFWGVVWMLALAKELFVIIYHFNVEANFVVWSFRHPIMTALLI